MVAELTSAMGRQGVDMSVSALVRYICLLLMIDISSSLQEMWSFVGVSLLVQGRYLVV